MEEKSTALVVQNERRALAPLDFTDEDRTIIRTSICPQASDAEFSSLMKVAALKRLNPLTGQIHFVKRKQSVDGQYIDRWTTQTAIDGFRLIADRTGLYDGQDEPEFEYDKDGLLIKCRVKVYRKDIARPFIGVAFFTEYAQYFNGKLGKMWDEKPHVMLAKCAEALGLRKAFPEDLGDLHVPEELGQDADGAAGVPAKRVLDAELVTKTEPTQATATAQQQPTQAQQPAQQKAAPTPSTAGGETLAAKEQRIMAALNEAATVERFHELRRELTALPKGAERDRLVKVYADGLAKAAVAAKGGAKPAEQPATLKTEAEPQLPLGGERQPGQEG